MPVDPSGSFKTRGGHVKAFAFLCGYKLFQKDPVVSTRLATRITAEPSYAATATKTGIDLVSRAMVVVSSSPAGWRECRTSTGTSTGLHIDHASHIANGIPKPIGAAVVA